MCFSKLIVLSRQDTLDLCSPPTLAALKFLLQGRASLMSTVERGACATFTVTVTIGDGSLGTPVPASQSPVLADLTRFLSLSRSFLPCSSRDELGNTHSKGLALCCHLLVECKALGSDLPHCADLAQVNTLQRRKHPHRLSRCVFLSCFRNLGMLLFFTVFQICQDEMIMNHVATSFRIF